MSKRYLVTETVKRTYVVTMTEEHLAAHADAYGAREDEMLAMDAVSHPEAGTEVLLVDVEELVEVMPEHDCDIPDGMKAQFEDAARRTVAQMGS